MDRQLFVVRAATRRAAASRVVVVQSPAARDRAPAALRRSLPREGQQGEAGAEPREGAGADDAAGTGDRGVAVHVPLPRTAVVARSGAGAGGRRLRLPERPGSG